MDTCMEAWASTQTDLEVDRAEVGSAVPNTKSKLMSKEKYKSNFVILLDFRNEFYGLYNSSFFLQRGSVDAGGSHMAGKHVHVGADVDDKSKDYEDRNVLPLDF